MAITSSGTALPFAIFATLDGGTIKRSIDDSRIANKILGSRRLALQDAEISTPTQAPFNSRQPLATLLQLAKLIVYNSSPRG